MAGYARPQSKSFGAALAISTAVFIRLLDVASDAWVAHEFYQQDQMVRFWSTVACLGLSGFVAGVIAAVRQVANERRRNPIVSFLLGCCHLQIVVEAYDSIRTGTKTGALKLLMSAAAITNTIPNCLFQTYIGFQNGWFWQLIVSVALALLSMSLTLISVEKEIYKMRGLGKLPLLSAYSVVLFMYRIVEVPSRILTLMLFAAAFSHLTWFLLAGDLFMLILVRSSTVRRQMLKQHRTRLSLTEAMSSMNHTLEELKELGILEQDADLQVESWTATDYVLRYLSWMLVYLEGLDPIPFLMLRLLEQAIMTALFLLFAEMDDYDTPALIITAVFSAVYFIISPLWQFWRSHAAFLHPKQVAETPSAVQLDVLKKMGEGSGEMRASEPPRLPDPEAGAPPPESRSVSESESSESEAEEKPPAPAPAPALPAPAAQTPQAAQTPTVKPSMSTVDTQYDWEGIFKDPEQQRRMRERRAPNDACRSCSGVADDTGCSVA
jgi:hypothetical protein